jgi:pyruvate,water dikinase
MKNQSVFQTRFIKPLSNGSKKRSIGEKANNLSRLKKFGFRIPLTYTCDWEASLRFTRGDRQVIENLRDELRKIIDPQKQYAIRSSSNIEDSLNYSFAGQFESLLNVQGVENILDAIMRIWQAAHSDQVLAYLNEHGLDENRIKMGVIIQEMVAPVLSGVVLTRNPVNRADEIIIEAVEGSGVELLQKGANAFRWVVKDNQVVESNNNISKYTDLISQLANDTAKIKKSLKMEVDVEWVFDGSDLIYVQCRPISNLSKIKVYSNRISRDMLPGLIKPLIWSVNIPLINSVWIGLLENFVGNLGVQPEDLSKQFYYRTYFNMGIFGRIFDELGMPPDSLEMMIGLREKDQPKPSMMPGAKVFRHIPRMAGFMLNNLFFARKMRKELGRLEKEIDRFRAIDVGSQSAQEILMAVDGLKPLVQQIAFFNITGPLAMSMYNNLLRKKLEKMGVDFLSFDLMKDSAESQRYDPNVDLEMINAIFLALPEKTRKKVEKSSFEGLKSVDGIDEFIDSLNKFIDKFGHFSDSGNDFSYVPWREKKDMILRMVLNFQKNEPTTKKTSFEDLRLKGLARNRLFSTYQRARDYRNLRDRVSSDYTFGYGLFRIFYLALGDLLTQQGAIQNQEDVFYLTDQQIHQAIEDPALGQGYKKIVQFHKKRMAQYADAVVPERIIGDEEPILGIEEKNKLAGIPASAGFYKGKACVISRVEDFPKMKTGQILVIPYSDVGWTPLFAKAGAVVAESGGMLSHSAIIAREYGLPAVVSVSGAMTIRSGRFLSVDANNGIVYLHD